MRTRAFRPEAPAGLEDRSLPSGLAAPSAHPFVLPVGDLSFLLDHLRSGFFLYTRYQDIGQVYSEIEDAVVLVPYQKADGLEARLDAIVVSMQQEIAAHVHGAVRFASLEVRATTLADVQARVRAGDVVVR